MNTGWWQGISWKPRWCCLAANRLLPLQGAKRDFGQHRCPPQSASASGAQQ